MSFCKLKRWYTDNPLSIVESEILIRGYFFEITCVDNYANKDGQF